MTTLSRADWIAEGTRRFGEDNRQWRFVCPMCAHVATPSDWYKARAPSGAVAFSCIGRWSGAKRPAFGGEGEGPCNYAGGGLFAVNPVRVIDDEGREHHVFAFAEETRTEAAE